MFTEIAIGFLLLFLLWIWQRKNENYPPGFWGLPLIGYIPWESKSADYYLRKLKEEHGNITMWRIGTRKMVFLYDYAIIKDCLNRVEFADRPSLVFFHLFSDIKNLGVIGSNGLPWQRNRRFSLRLLKDLGMGKSRMVGAIQHEAAELVKHIKALEGKPARVPHALVVAIINVLWQMVASKRYDVGHDELREYDELITQAQKNVVPLLVQDFFPWVLYVLPKFIRRKLFKINIGYAVRAKLDNFLQKIVEEHERDMNPDDPRDYIDHYLIEMKNQEDNPESTMSKRDLSECINDFFRAGSETTSTTLTWTFFYLVKYPLVQQKVHAEIDKALPKGTAVFLEDKDKFPYTEAVIHEIHRHASFTKLGLMRQTTEDVLLGGYLIPKGAYINPVAAACHRDPKYWKSPNEFLPERFLDQNGKFQHPKDGFMPFGSGKRQCLGESLARLELFIFLVTIMQNFSLSAPPGKSIDLTPLSVIPIFNFPNEDQEIVFTGR